jgi:hypothetical protein
VRCCQQYQRSFLPRRARLGFLRQSATHVAPLATSLEADRRAGVDADGEPSPTGTFFCSLKGFEIHRRRHLIANRSASFSATRRQRSKALIQVIRLPGAKKQNVAYRIGERDEPVFTNPRRLTLRWAGRGSKSRSSNSCLVA